MYIVIVYYHSLGEKRCEEKRMRAYSVIYLYVGGCIKNMSRLMNVSIDIVV